MPQNTRQRRKHKQKKQIVITAGKQNTQQTAQGEEENNVANTAMIDIQSQSSSEESNNSSLETLDEVAFEELIAQDAKGTDGSIQSITKLRRMFKKPPIDTITDMLSLFCSPIGRQTKRDRDNRSALLQKRTDDFNK